MNNIEINNLNLSLGDTFINWALDYFTDKNLNIKIIKEEMYDDYLKNVKKIPKNVSNFKKCIKDYCSVRNRENKNTNQPIWDYNPVELSNEQGRFLINVAKENGKMIAKEFIIIQTKPANC